MENGQKVVVAGIHRSKSGIVQRLLESGILDETYEVVSTDNDVTDTSAVDEFRRNGVFSEEVEPKEVVEQFVFRQMPSDLELMSYGDRHHSVVTYNVGSKKAKKEKYKQKKLNKAIRRAEKRNTRNG